MKPQFVELIVDGQECNVTTVEDVMFMDRCVVICYKNNKVVRTNAIVTVTTQIGDNNG